MYMVTLGNGSGVDLECQVKHHHRLALVILPLLLTLDTAARCVHSLKIFTGRNEVVAKVSFLHLSVILFTGGGVSLSACWDTPLGSRHPWEQTPLGPDTHTPPDQTPPGLSTPLRTNYTPQGPSTPPAGTKYTPLHGKQTPSYSQRAAGTHPTGMHSCVIIFMIRLFIS